MRRFSLFVVCAALLMGCSDRSFIGKRYDNFTAYYNTFYNAQKAFEKGVEAIDQSEQPVDRTTYLSLFGAPAQASNTQAFEDAIGKSADVLREHPNSKWVDDALMMIGKSYFYQRNYVGAEQKFREVMGLDSGLEGEARFWLARALIAAGRYAAADEHLRASLSLDEDFGRWAAMMSLAQGELAVQRENWSGAAEALARGLDGDVGGEEAAQAAFLLGQVEETRGNFEAATAAYERAAEYRSRYELNYAARISAIRTKGLHGQPEEALSELRDMETDDKNFEKRAELRLLRGRLYQATGRLDEARRIYRELLYGDDASRQGGVSGRVHYALAELYRDAYQNFSVAAAHFDTASTSISRPSGQGSGEQEQPARAPAAITDSREQATIFGEVADKSETVTRLDSLLRLGTMEDEEFRTFIAEIREQRAEEQAAREEARRNRESARRFNTAGAANTGQRDGGGTTSTAAAATGSSDAGFLFHNDPVRVQEARRSFEQQWGRRPLVPNWRRRAAIVASTSSSDDSTAPASGADSLVVGRPGGPSRGSEAMGEGGPSGAGLVDISEVPRDSSSRAEMQSQRALARYELGNALFLAAGRPDSAITWYRRVVENDYNESVARRALYALAEAHSALGDTAQARSLYQRLLAQYPDSEFAARAREQLGEAPVSQSVPSDSTALAETAYASAYDAWQNDRHTEALRQMVDVAAEYPQTQIAPRALLAAGSIFMEQQPPDSLTASTPLPDFFTSILAAQPKTVAVPDSAQRPTAPPDSAQTPPDSTRRSMEVPQTIETGGPRRDSTRRGSTRRPPVRQDSARGALKTDSTARAVASDSASVASDSVAAADSTARSDMASDSLRADSLRANSLQADSLRADSLQVDSLRTAARVDSVRSDSAAVRADSLRAVSERGARSEPQVAAEGPSGPVLRMLYAYITEQYPESPQADRASRVLQALDETAAAADTSAAPDSTALPAADSTARPLSAPDAAAADSVASDSVASDSLSAPPSDSLSASPDSLAAPSADSTAADSTDADSTALPPPPSPRAQPDTTASPDTSSALPGPTTPARRDTTAQERN